MHNCAELDMRGIASKMTSLHLIIIILSVSFAVYFNALFNDFVYDDIYQVLKNQWITDVRNLTEIFSKSVWSFEGGVSTSNYYRPMMHVIYMINYHIFGFNPLGFHLVNVLFHCGSSVFVFLVVSRLLNGSNPAAYPSIALPPFMAALLFATHPIHTEAVAWVSGLPDLSFTFFFILAFYFFIRSQGEVRNYYYFFSVAFFFVATLCKETALTLPIILLAYDFVFGEKALSPPGFLKRYILFFLVVGFYFLLRVHALEGFAPHKLHSNLSIYERVINVFPLFIQYLEKLILPINLSALHSFHPVASILEMKGILSLTVSAALVVLAVTAFRQNRRIVFSFLLIVIPLMPSFYIAMLPHPYAERYLYLPSIGFVMLLVLLFEWLMEKAAKQAAIMIVLPMALIGLYSVATINRNTVWKNNYTLWGDTVRKSPADAVPWINLGSALLENNRTDEAIEHLLIALRLNPASVETHNNLGNAYCNKGLIDLAIKHYGAALRLKPAFAEAHNNLGNAYYVKGLIDKAVEHYEAALRLKPDFAKAHYNLGNVYHEKGFTDKAIEHFRAAVKLKPDYMEARQALESISK